MGCLARRLLAFALAIGSVSGLALAQNASTLSKKADPAGTGPLMNQLRGLFASWDGNGDGVLDRTELAVAFRGPDARPPTPIAKPKDAGPAGEKKSDKSTAKNSSHVSRDRSQLPDYEFLVEVDLNGDGKVTRDEFLNWARQYAVLKKNIDATEAKRAKAEARALTRTTAAARLQAEVDLKVEQKALEKLSAQLPPFEKQLRKQLKPPDTAKKAP